MNKHGYTATLASNAGAGNGTAANWVGGRGIFIAEATWGGGSAKLQIQSPNGTWVDVDGITLSANGTKQFVLPRGLIRTVIATASAAYIYVSACPD